ncbi:MAG: hypothetical protein AB7U38_12325 [Hyphomicrobiales bacterium]
MSIEQVRAAQPNAVPHSIPSNVPDGPTCELQIPNYDVSIYLFDVCFLFREGRLEQVDLRAQAATIATYEGAARLLRARYGESLSQQSSLCRPRPPVTLCSTQWLVEGGVDITLLFVGTLAQQAVSIVYKTGLRDTVDRL